MLKVRYLIFEISNQSLVNSLKEQFNGSSTNLIIDIYF